MRLISDQNQQFLEKLTALAGGDFSLVLRALDKADHAGSINLVEAVKFIADSRRRKSAADGSEAGQLTH